MRFMFRNFPLATAHPHAERAAEAAEAAGAQDQFWAMQAWESLLFVGLAVGLVALSVWWVRRATP